MERKLNKFYTGIIVFVFSIAFFVQDLWFISDWDDMFYKFIVADPNQGTVWQLMHGEHQYIRSFSDIIYSQYNHYLGSNGRFIVHCFVQACTSFLSHRQFAIVNSIVFFILLWGMAKLADDRMPWKKTLFIGVSLAVLSPLTMADFFANIAWSVNYLWSATATIWWLIMYQEINTDRVKVGVPYIVLIFLLSVIVGSLQEGFSVGICVGLGLYHLLRIKDFTIPKFAVVGGYIIGSLICILSPANFIKADDETKGLSIDAILDILMTYSIILFCILFVICLFIGKDKLWRFVKENAVLFISFVFTLCFCLFFVYHGSRQYTLATLLSIVLTVRLINEYNNKGFQIMQTTITTVGLLLCVVFYPKMYQLRMNIGKAYYDICAKEMKTKAKIVYNASYEIARYEIERSNLSRYFHINKFNGNPESRYLSIHVSGGSDMNYIEAVLPVSIEEMQRKCSETKIACLYNDIYACALDKRYAPQDVVWKYQTTFRNPYKWHEFSSEAQYVVKYESKYYYIFHTYTNKIKGDVLEIKRAPQ